MLSSFPFLQFLRLLLALTISLVLSRTFDLGLSSVWVTTALCAGVIISGSLVRRAYRLRRVLMLHTLLAVLIFIIFQLIDLFQGSFLAQTPQRDFLLYRLAQSFWLLASLYLSSLLMTWYYWTQRAATTLEGTLLAALFLLLLAPHRNYQLDAPKKLNALAWELNVEPQHFLLFLGMAFTVALSFYLIVSEKRRLFSTELLLQARGRVTRVLAFVIPLAVLALFSFYAYQINARYQADLSRAANGVNTSGNKEGQTPLGFHSAVGKTKQPAALIRLEGDYSQNPWSPMLYLRESALSEYNGRELVVANAKFDTDVPRVALGQPYTAQSEQLPAQRIKLVHSIYLLTRHNSPFAVDFPFSLRLLKNPDPAKFELAYQALSFAPMLKLDNLGDRSAADPSWDETTRAHYLRAPGSHSLALLGELSLDFTKPLSDSTGEDLRYALLSRSVTAGATTAAAKAQAISEYLSRESIYTRRPGYSVDMLGDPVAPYLFAKEKRGYCVHFSHAAAYLLRLAGIPARIATGYLTDLSYAKDGHALLHLGDRHAWAEIYLEGAGWVVIDVTPQRAENEQMLIPDEKLLEELMGKLSPAEELGELASEIAGDESATEIILGRLLDRRLLLTIFAMGLCVFLVLKLWLRFAWLLPFVPRRRIHWAFTALASLATDIGSAREEGETHREYCGRLAQSHGLGATILSDLQEKASYARTPPAAQLALLRHALRTALASFSGPANPQWLKSKSRFIQKMFNLLSRILAFLSPLSLLRWWRW